jgi:hypothetical protein
MNFCLSDGDMIFSGRRWEENKKAILIHISSRNKIRKNKTILFSG